MSQSPEIHPVHLVVGEEALLVQEAVEAIVSAAFGGGSPGFNLARFQAGEGASGALEVANTLPMMAKRRVVQITELEKANVELLDALLAYVEKPNPSTVLVLSGAKLPPKSGGKDRGRVLSNLVTKLGAVQRFQTRDQDPHAFIVAHARSLGCELDSRAARLLVELSGTDLGRLRSEVDKAAAYVGGEGAIGMDIISTTTSMVAEAVVWELTDAVVARDADRGLTAVYRMMEAAGSGDRVSYRLLALITWQIRQLLLLQESLHRGGELPKSWARIPHRKRQDAESLLRRRPLSAERMLGALAAANQDFNRARAGDRRVFENLVLQLTTS